MLLVGLGNPGKQYELTRHNVGFMVIDSLASMYNAGSFKEKFLGSYSTGLIGNQKVHLLKPLTYMNRSGQSIAALCQFFQIPAEQVIVIHDDLDLVTGKVRVKQGGGHGGHNGLKSIDSHLGVNYFRIRFGISHPGDKFDVADYVLHPFSTEERVIVQQVVDSICKHIELMLKGDLDHFMSKVAQHNG